ncbi:GNAT family N-acetyltransferase [Bacillus gaemokensis]|uniref:Acetyltransferase n=1 Tax=Bacillus gaemokensis TaxID=574375 RepID=A0A073KBY1_9BACI|nr:GNAT family N-acetyltransferase [Bacillus gaemokensis]KEK24026.1 acetyltransferase [Bacillus gaemokensis]KYG27231.1 acetyltransferase [Bacillus gaemokensis]
MQNRKATTNDYNIILNLWEKSVTATHSFLSFDDKQEIKREIPLYFPHLDVRIWYVENSLIGFSAINQNHLEMLFLDPNEIGKGYGKQIIQLLINNFGVKTVDVNKDNENAKKFYLKNGFSIVSEQPTDDSGRPYPILHLKLQ